jgi:hypothetical protein
MRERKRNKAVSYCVSCGTLLQETNNQHCPACIARSEEAKALGRWLTRKRSLLRTQYRPPSQSHFRLSPRHRGACP